MGGCPRGPPQDPPLPQHGPISHPERITRPYIFELEGYFRFNYSRSLVVNRETEAQSCGILFQLPDCLPSQQSPQTGALCSPYFAAP